MCKRALETHSSGQSTAFDGGLARARHGCAPASLGLRSPAALRAEPGQETGGSGCASRGTERAASRSREHDSDAAGPSVTCVPQSAWRVAGAGPASDDLSLLAGRWEGSAPTHGKSACGWGADVHHRF